MNASFKFFNVAFLVLITSAFVSASVFAQTGGQQTGTGGQTGAGDFGTGTTGTGQLPTTPQQNTNFNTGGPVDLGGLLDFSVEPPAVEVENERVQPFVGQSLERYGEQELIHPRSLIAASNSGQGGGGNGGGGFSFTTNRGNQGLQQAGQGNAVEVVRRSLRTRAVPRFNVPSPRSTQQVSTEFEQRLQRIPATSDAAVGVQIQVQGTTAVLTGTVDSAEERERVERMARLEPGIYQIDNRINISQ